MVLWYINYGMLFNGFMVYQLWYNIYWFYGISTMVCYLMALWYINYGIIFNGFMVYQLWYVI